MTLKTLPTIQQPPPPPQQPQQSLLSWIPIDTRRRILFFIIFSPILIPLFCLYVPLICISKLYIFLFRRRREKRRRGDECLRRCEEGLGRQTVADAESDIGWLLMQRYLEDQLRLVGSVVAVYDCGREDEHEHEHEPEIEDYCNVGGNLDENRRPLLL